VTGDDPKADDMSYIGPFWVSTVVAGLWGGEVWVAETDDTEKKIIGCAVWFGPGHTMYDSCFSSSNLYRFPYLNRTTSEDQQKYALGLLMAGFTYELKNWWRAALSNPYMYCGISPDFDYQLLPQYEVVLTSALGQGIKHSSWHLHTLAVDPEYERKGAARSLVNAIVEKASQPGSMLCVEGGNETNVKRHFTGLLVK
jgi:ribosomal protein S18 acetylase RimI-like enzyme